MTDEHHHLKPNYYLPEPSHWPIVGSIGLTCLLVGVANWLHENAIGPYVAGLGLLITLYMVVGWFGTVIRENQAGNFQNEMADNAFRSGMIWFIFSEVMFFCVFFGALFYTRVYTVPWLGGVGGGALTHILLWPNFESTWPLFHNPDPAQFGGQHSVMNTWGIPALNTLILLTSGVTITFAHWGLLQKKRRLTLISQALTILLGLTFLVMQVVEYGEAYTEKALTLHSGIYGSTFFMLTGFHGFHVTLGSIMLTVILWRLYRGHFDEKHHFAFEAVAWYWHFVDVVWLGLFIFVYWL